jgi:hypothetical protein
MTVNETGVFTSYGDTIVVAFLKNVTSEFCPQSRVVGVGAKNQNTYNGFIPTLAR